MSGHQGQDVGAESGVETGDAEYDDVGGAEAAIEVPSHVRRASVGLNFRSDRVVDFVQPSAGNMVRFSWLLFEPNGDLATWHSRYFYPPFQVGDEVKRAPTPVMEDEDQLIRCRKQWGWEKDKHVSIVAGWTCHPTTGAPIADRDGSYRPSLQVISLYGDQIDWYIEANEQWREEGGLATRDITRKSEDTGRKYKGRSVYDYTNTVAPGKSVLALIGKENSDRLLKTAWMRFENWIPGERKYMGTPRPYDEIERMLAGEYPSRNDDQNQQVQGSRHQQISGQATPAGLIGQSGNQFGSRHPTQIGARPPAGGAQVRPPQPARPAPTSRPPDAEPVTGDFSGLLQAK